MSVSDSNSSSESESTSYSDGEPNQSISPKNEVANNGNKIREIGDKKDCQSVSNRDSSGTSSSDSESKSSESSSSVSDNEGEINLHKSGKKRDLGTAVPVNVENVEVNDKDPKVDSKEILDTCLESVPKKIKLSVDETVEEKINNNFADESIPAKLLDKKCNQENIIDNKEMKQQQLIETDNNLTVKSIISNKENNENISNKDPSIKDTNLHVDQIKPVKNIENNKEVISKSVEKYSRRKSRSPPNKVERERRTSRERNDRHHRTNRSRNRSRSRSRHRSRSINVRRHRSRSRSKSRGRGDRHYDRRERQKRPRSRSRNRERYDGRRNRYPSPRRNKDADKADNKSKETTDPKEIPPQHRRTIDLLTSKTGGAYIPPAKLRMMQAEITDKSSMAYQRIAWEALKKSIHGYINKVNVDNIGIITRELLKENIVRGRGLLCRSIIQAQAASPTFSHVYAALVSIINSKFPNIGELLVHRLIIQFKRGFRRNDKSICLSSTRFIAHLVNQRVAHEILALEILTLLVETPTDDSVEVAIAFLKECGMKLTEVSSKGISAIFEMLKNILHEGQLEKRVQYMIEVVFQVRKDGFKDNIAVIEPLELVEEDDQFTHLITLEDAKVTDDALNVFKFDENYEANEEKYKGLTKELLGSDVSDSDNNSESGSDDSDSDAEEAETEKTKQDLIIDNTETNLVALRRTIYLTIHSSLDYEECAHKLMKMQLKPGQEMELCHMFLDCCAEQRTYEKFYGLLAQRFCIINKTYVCPFEEIFKDTYHTTHRLDTNRLRNVSKFFAHLFFTDAISWDVFECIKLNEDDTTSSSRIFIKILFQELAEYMGLGKLNTKLKDPALHESLSGLFPKDNPRNTRFAINFFTSIGLGGLTDDLREFLKNTPKSVPAINQEILNSKNVNSSSSSSSTSSSSSSSDSSSSSSSSSDAGNNVRNKKKLKKLSAGKNKKSRKISKPEKKKSLRRKHKKKVSSNESSSSSSEDSSSSSSTSSTSESSISSVDKKARKKRYFKK